MPKVKKDSSKKEKKNKKKKADNEIIIGVTTKPKEKVRVGKKSTRTKKNTPPKKETKKKETTAKKKMPKKTQDKKRKVNVKKRQEEDQIKTINRKKVMISVLILLGIVIGGIIYYLTTPVFNIAHIMVYGNSKNSVDTYISLSKINIGTTNLFAITKNGIKKNLKEDAYVEEVVMKRKLPNTVELYVTERTVDYQIEYAHKYIYLNNQGYLLEISEKKQNVPILYGLTSVKENIQIGQRVNHSDLLRLDTVLKIINYCKYNSIENKITSINVEDTSNYILNFDQEKQKAYLGDASNLSERILWLKTILQKEKGNKGEIFINGDLKEDRVYFREETK